LWDSQHPKFSDPSYFPHIIHWTSGGLIKKLLIKTEIPKHQFWLAQSQLSLVSEQMLDLWDGDYSDDEVPDSDEEGTDKESDEETEGTQKETTTKRKIDPFFVNDVRDNDGVSLLINYVNAFQEKIAASEYHPGGVLYIKLQVKFVCFVFCGSCEMDNYLFCFSHLQSLDHPVEEAFFTSAAKSTRMDMFSPQSGEKVGLFSLETAIPWLPTVVVMDATGRSKTQRAPVSDLSYTLDQRAVVYRLPESMEAVENNAHEHHGEQEPIESSMASVSGLVTDVETVWQCPPPKQGGVTFVVNYRLKGSTTWNELTCSVKESPLR
jgi:hypothetical protein